MNIYQIVDVRTGEVMASLRAANRREAAEKAIHAGRSHFRVRCVAAWVPQTKHQAEANESLGAAMSANIA